MSLATAGLERCHPYASTGRLCVKATRRYMNTDRRQQTEDRVQCIANAGTSKTSAMAVADNAQLITRPQESCSGLSVYVRACLGFSRVDAHRMLNVCLPHDLSSLKKTCVRQVALDKWFPLNVSNYSA